MNKKVILMTGATGFLGSYLLGALIKDFNIIITVRSQSKYDRIKKYLNDIVIININNHKVENIFKNNKIDIVLHCGTNYGYNNSHLHEIVDSNLMMPLELLTFSSRYNIDYFINTDTIIDKNVNGYSLSKSQFKEWLVYDKSRFKKINIALSHFYGPGDNKTKFIENMIQRHKDNESLIELTPGKQKRNFLYIDDVVNAFILIINNLKNLNENYTKYEIASMDSTTIKQVVTTINSLIPNNTKLCFGALPYRKNETMNYKTNLTKIHSLGWKQMVTLKDGLLQNIEQSKEVVK
jgi:CDP-paratose synthetase